MRVFAAVAFALVILTLVPLASAQQWWDPAYQFRRQIIVANNNPSENLENGYTVFLTFDHASLVSQGKSLANGDDVRIVYQNSIELDRINVSQWNQPNTTIALKTVQNIFAGSSTNDYFIYYGNAGSGNPPRNPNNVYAFFDNFNDGVINPLWQQTQGSWTEAGGVVTSLSSTSQLILMQSYSNVNIEVSMKPVYHAGTTLRYSDNSNFYLYSLRPSGITQLFRFNGGGYTILGQNVSQAFEFNKVLFRSFNDRLTGIVNSNDGLVSVNDVMFNNGNIGLWGYANSQFDYIIVRKYIEPEPIIIVGQEMTPSVFGVQSPQNITYRRGNIDYNLTYLSPVTAVTVDVAGMTVPLTNDFGNHWVSSAFDHPTLPDGPHIALFRIFVNAQEVNSSSVSFFVNRPPAVSVPDQFILEDSSLNNNLLYIPAFVMDNLTTSENLIYTLTRIPSNNVVDCSIDTSLFLDCSTTTLNGFGSDQFALSASDGFSTTTAIFTVFVLPVNDPPHFIALPNLTLDTNSGFNNNILHIPSYAIDVDNASNELTFSITSQTAPQIVDCSLDSQNFLDCTVESGQSGSSTITLAVSDGEFTVEGQLTIKVATPITACGSISQSGLYYLANNVNSPGTCFSITASHLELDCTGRTITYSQSQPGYGISAISVLNLSIQNCVIQQISSNANSFGISLDDVPVSTIENNVITTTGSNSDGIRALSSLGNSYIGNTITTSGAERADGIELTFWTSNNIITSNRIRLLGGGASGILLNASLASHNNTITENVINATGQFSSAVGLEYSNENTISGNVLKSFGPSSSSLYLSHASQNTITSNNIFASSPTSAAVRLLISGSNTISENSIGDTLASNISAQSTGLSLTSSSGNTILNNRIAGGLAASLSESNGNLIANNMFNTTSTIIVQGLQPNSFNNQPIIQPNIIGGPQTGGNYYARPDGSGYSQTCAENDGDGFCDSPFVFNQSNADLYPLFIAPLRIVTANTPSIGSTITLTVSDLLHPNRNYVLALSTSTVPPFSILGITVPLTPNSIFWASLFNPNVIGLSGSVGPLDQLGRGQATLQIPNHQSLAGLTIYLAALSADQGVAIFTPGTFSLTPAFPLTFQP